MRGNFTGYITLEGRHIEDGLKHPPTTFEEKDDYLILRWLEIYGGKAYEVEQRIPKELALFINLDQNKTGIGALNALKRWRLQHEAT